MFVDYVKTNKHMFKLFSPSGSHTILVYRSYTDMKHRAASLRQQSFLFCMQCSSPSQNTRHILSSNQSAIGCKGTQFCTSSDWDPVIPTRSSSVIKTLRRPQPPVWAQFPSLWFPSLTTGFIIVVHRTCMMQISLLAEGSGSNLPRISLWFMLLLTVKM